MISRETVRRAKAAIKRWADYEYFFDKLISPDWLQSLCEEGFFQNPPDPVREDGYIRFPIWPESRYLVRVASLEPKRVADILCKLPKTENPRVHDDVVDAALAMPPSDAARLAKQIGSYVRSDYHLQLPNKLGNLILYLARGGMKKEALDLLKGALALKPDPNVQERRAQRLPPEPSSFIEDYHYGEILKVTAVELTRLFGMDALRCLGLILENYTYGSRLNDAYRGPDDASYLRRSAIEDHEQNWGHSIIDPMITAVRDSALELCVADPNSLPVVLEYLEGRSWFVFWRIAMFLLYNLPGVPATLAASRILDEQRFKRAGLRHEYVLLLATHYAALKDAEKVAILRMIEEDQAPEDIRRIYGSAGTELSDEEVCKIADRRRLKRLHPISIHLTGEAKALYDQLIAQYRQPEHPEFLTYNTGVIIGPNSPSTADELRTMPMVNLIEFLRNWQQSEDEFMGPSPEGLGRVLSEAVATDATRFAAAADQFIGLQPTYVRFFLHGMEQAAESGSLAASWSTVLSLASWAVEQHTPEESEADGVYADRDPHWGWTRKQVADLLAVGVSKEGSGLSSEYADQVWAILARLVEDPDPTPVHEERYGGDNMDPLTLSVNSTRGAAMHAVFQYALWRKRHATVEMGIPDEVRQVLDSHLDPIADPSLAVRAVYGRWLPWIHHMDPNWTEENLAAIFPKDEVRLRSAAWGAYISFCLPYNGMLPLLNGEYTAAIDRLAPQVGRQSLAEHLCVFYFRGLLPLETGTNPLHHLFDRAEASLRVHALSFIGRTLDQHATDIKHEVIDRLKQLWEWRFQVASAATDPAPYINELVEFGSWFASGSFDEEWSIAQLMATLQLTGHVKYGDDVVERLAEVASRHPADTLACLELLLNGKPDHTYIYLWQDHAREILRIALADNDPKVRSTSEQVVHTLGAMGYSSYRNLLNPATSVA